MKGIRWYFTVPAFNRNNILNICCEAFLWHYNIGCRACFWTIKVDSSLISWPHILIPVLGFNGLPPCVMGVQKTYLGMSWKQRWEYYFCSTYPYFQGNQSWHLTWLTSVTVMPFHLTDLCDSMEIICKE